MNYKNRKLNLKYLYFQDIELVIHMMKVNLRLLLGMLAFGSIWGLLECVLGSVRFGGTFAFLPMGAILGGFVGLGLMAYTRKMFNVMGMQLGMGIIAGLLRFWSPIGTCVICSALAIVFEAVIFELIFNWKALSIVKTTVKSQVSIPMLIPLGIISGYTIYVSGYMFTQIFTPIISAGSFVLSDFLNVLPLIFGKGFFAAIFGGLALPLAVSVNVPTTNVFEITKKPYYITMTFISVICWFSVITLSLTGFFS